VRYHRAMIARPLRRPLRRLMIAGIALASFSGTASAGGNAADIKACNLLTLDEIKQVTGVAMGAGLLQTTDSQASCDWNAPDGSSGASAVGISVQNYDDDLWTAMSGSKYAVPVKGIGEKAFKGLPHQGDLSVKVGKYEVDVGIVDFRHDDATVDAAALKLMKLVLPRL
jgi:hypothetical protein